MVFASPPTTPSNYNCWSTIIWRKWTACCANFPWLSCRLRNHCKILRTSRSSAIWNNHNIQISRRACRLEDKWPKNAQTNQQADQQSNRFFAPPCFEHIHIGLTRVSPHFAVYQSWHLLTWTVEPADVLWFDVALIIGWAKARTKNVKKSMRDNKVSQCLTLRADDCCWMISRKNVTLVKIIFLGLCKSNKCKAMGIAIAKRPNKKNGFRKVITDKSIKIIRVWLFKESNTKKIEYFRLNT